jgi:hypothetical protein
VTREGGDRPLWIGRALDYRGCARTGALGVTVYAVALLVAVLSFLVHSAVHVAGRRLDWQGAVRDRP